VTRNGGPRSGKSGPRALDLIPGKVESESGLGSACGRPDSANPCRGGVDSTTLLPVTTSDERATSRARTAAIEQVDQALASGRIVQADHDLRVDQLRGAQTMQDVDLQVRELPPLTPAPPLVQQWPLVNYGPGAPGATTPGSPATSGGNGGKGGRAIGGVIVAVILVAVIVPIAGVIIAFVSARSSFPEFSSVGPTDETTYAPGQVPGKDGVNLHTVSGYQDLVDAVRSEFHATYAYEAVIYPRYAVVELPTGTNNRYQDFYWNGDELQLQDIKGTSEEPQVDLALLDPQQMIDMLDTVRSRTDHPDSWYVVYADFGQGPQVSAYASNDFGENNYLVESLDGTVVYDSENQG
jgi:hypothetical protein